MNTTELPVAESMPYWKTSKSGVETWLDKTEKLIESVKGNVHTRINGKSNGKEAIMIGFRISNDEFKLLWPVLKTKNEKDKAAAQRQAATAIFHDTKARVGRIRVFGPKVTFFDYLVLSDGRSVAEVGGITDVTKLLRS